MNRANRSEQGSTCRERSEPCSGALTLHCFRPQPAIHRHEQLLLGSLALALMHALFHRTPGLTPAAQAKAKDYPATRSSCNSCDTSHQLTQISPVLYCTERTKVLASPHLSCRALLPTPHVSHPCRKLQIVASSNLLNVWDMLESCKIVGYPSCLDVLLVAFFQRPSTDCITTES